MRLKQFFTIILLPVDYTMLVLAAFTAYFLRFESGFVEIVPAISIIPFGWYFFLSFLIPIFWLIIFAVIGLYRTDERRFFDDIPRIIFACSTGIMFVIGLIFFNREFFASRFVILVAWIFAIIFVSFGRMLVNNIYYLFRKKGLGLLRVAIIGGGRTADAIRSEYGNNYLLGRKIVLHALEFDEGSRMRICELRTSGFLDELIYVGEPNRELHNNILAFCEENHINFKYSADFFATALPNISLSTVAGIPLVDVKQTRLDIWGRVYKRIFDIYGSLFLIIITLPIMLLTALLIRLESPGSIFYKNERVGNEGRLFYLYKFRSMFNKYCVGKENNEEALHYEEDLIARQNTKTGPVYKIGNDPRVTRVGRFIRRWSIDELPQFFNVFLGQMSLVGPRPHQPREVMLYERHHKKVLAIKPGITGSAQISGRSDLTFEEEVRLDKYYIDNWSIWMDIYILLKTPRVVLSKKGAY